MPQKIKITKGDIIDKATRLVRESGAESLNARALAKALGCSTQPIFSNFSNMDELKLAVVSRAEGIYGEYIKAALECGKYPQYKATGMAYTRFAREEKHLFSLLYMRDRSGEDIDEKNALFESVITILQKSLGLSRADAEIFHLEMWAYVHGIGTMLATGYLSIDDELISRMLTDNFEGLKTRFGVKK